MDLPWKHWKLPFTKPCSNDKEVGEELQDMPDINALRRFDFEEEPIDHEIIRSSYSLHALLDVTDDTNSSEDVESMISGDSIDTSCDSESSEGNAYDCEDGILFFNYNSDGSNYNPFRSPIKVKNNQVRYERKHQFHKLVYDSEEEEADVLMNLTKETGHENCECRTLDWDCGTYPRLRIKQDHVSISPLSPYKTLTNMRNNIARLSDKDDFVNFVEEISIEEEMRYVSVASKQEPFLSVKLFAGESSDLNNHHHMAIQVHLLHAILRSFFTCPDDAISVEWTQSIHYKTMQLLRRENTNMKFCDREDFDNKLIKKACLLLSRDASVLLRDACSSLLTNIADILQINRKNVLVLDTD